MIILKLYFVCFLKPKTFVVPEQSMELNILSFFKNLIDFVIELIRISTEL
jgi:hypothetical protein